LRRGHLVHLLGRLGPARAAGRRTHLRRRGLTRRLTAGGLDSSSASPGVTTLRRDVSSRGCEDARPLRTRRQRRQILGHPQLGLGCRLLEGRERCLDFLLFFAVRDRGATAGPSWNCRRRRRRRRSGVSVTRVAVSVSVSLRLDRRRRGGTTSSGGRHLASFAAFASSSWNLTLLLLLIVGRQRQVYGHHLGGSHRRRHHHRVSTYIDTRPPDATCRGCGEPPPKRG
jgi:hypothetical protein